MTIEGLGKKFQEARQARKLTLDEAARMTKIRPSRLAEIEADDFSQFPSLAYAKGFLLIYGKFLEVDVTPYMEAFETSDAVTVDGYSYLQTEVPDPTPVRTPVVRRRPERVRSAPRASSGGERTSIMPLVIGVVVLVIGFFAMKFILNVTRLTRRTEPQVSAPTAAASAAPTAAASPIASATPPTVAAVAPSAPAVATATAPIVTATPVIAASSPVASVPVAAATATARAVVATTPSAAPKPVVAATTAPVPPKTGTGEPEVRRAEPVKPEDLAKATVVESTGANRVAIKPLKKTYVKVVIDDESNTPAFERWISPADGTVEFRGQKFSVRLIDRQAVQIRKNGKTIEGEDPDVTVED